MRKLILIPILFCSCSSNDNSIGTSGGTITIEGGPTLEFPEGAATEEIEIVVEKTGLPQNSNYQVLSDVWKCEPDGTDFAFPVKVTMPYTPDGKAEPPVLFWSFGGADFAPVPDAQLADGIASGSIRHFSVGFVGRTGS